MFTVVWPFRDRPDPLRERVRALERTCEQLADDVTYLEKRIRQLTGRVTGGLRDTEKPDRPEGKGDGRATILDRLRASRGA